MSLRALLTSWVFVLGVLLRLAIAAWAWRADLGWLSLAGLALFDLALYLAVAAAAKAERARQVAAILWLSPVTIILVYGLAQPAIIAAAVLAGGFAALRPGRLMLFAAGVGLAGLIEPLAFAVAPFAVLFLMGSARMRRLGRGPCALVAASVLAALALAAWSSDWRAMAAAHLGWVGLTVPLVGGAGVSAAVLALAGLGYVAWRVRRLDADLTAAFSGLALLALLVISGAPALALLATPFVVVHAAYAGAPGRLAAAGLAAGVLGMVLAPGMAAATVLAVGGLLTGAQVIQRGVLRSPHYLALRRPFVIGIAGDSGAGKDTLAAGIEGLFGEPATAQVSGDDHHLWDRGKPAWRALTHLNPKANDLDAFARLVKELADRRWVRTRRYDHGPGRRTRPRRLHIGDVVIASGLHALHPPALARVYDLRIYLDMDEGLRRALKTRRDVEMRGHDPAAVAAAIDRRADDAARFIHPQRAAADLVMRLEPRRPGDVEALRLVCVGAAGRGFDRLARLLAGVCGLLAVEEALADGGARLTVEGEAASDDIAAVARRLAPAMADIIQLEPQWRPGLAGVMQLIVLDQLDHIRHRRSVNA